jgi:hypothetical protein
MSLTQREIADTSRQALQEERASGRLGWQQVRILRWIRENGGAHTRAELSERLGIRLSSICGRVHELVAVGELVEGPRRRCSVTGRAAHPVRLAPQQLSLLEASDGGDILRPTQEVSP